MKKTKENLINIGTGREARIIDYKIHNRLGLNLDIKFDKSYPDGTPRKILDISLAKKYGWVANKFRKWI